MPALSALLHRYKRGHRLRTGADSLDRDLAFLHDQEDSIGLPSCGLTEVSGPPGSGKTCLVLCLVNDALRSGLSVLWLGCNFRPLPYMRLRQINGGKLPTVGKLQGYYIADLAQLLVLDVTGYDLVVIEHYDGLVETLGSKNYKRRRKQVTAMLNHMFQIASTTTVVATSTLVPRYEHPSDELTTMLPPLSYPKNHHAARILLYRYSDGEIITSTGARLCIETRGIRDGSGRVETTDFKDSYSLSLSEPSSSQLEHATPLYNLPSSPLPPNALNTPQSGISSSQLKRDVADISEALDAQFELQQEAHRQLPSQPPLNTEFHLGVKSHVNQDSYPKRQRLTSPPAPSAQSQIGLNPDNPEHTDRPHTPIRTPSPPAEPVDDIPASQLEYGDARLT